MNRPHTILGALLTFPLGEKFGRKKAIMFASLVFLLGGILMVTVASIIMQLEADFSDCLEW